MTDVARLLCIGLSRFNYTENEIMCMTPRKFFLINGAYKSMESGSGNKNDNDAYSIDDFWGAL